VSAAGGRVHSIDGRLALSLAEAARALGVSERHVREILPELPHIHLGRRVVIPVVRCANGSAIAREPSDRALSGRPRRSSRRCPIERMLCERRYD